MFLYSNGLASTRGKHTKWRVSIRSNSLLHGLRQGPFRLHIRQLSGGRTFVLGPKLGSCACETIGFGPQTTDSFEA